VKQFFVLLLCAAALWTSRASADAVSDWNSTANVVLLKSARPAGALIIDMAYVHIAIYDAVNAIDGRFTRFAVTPSSSASWASEDAATAAAAYGVLLSLYPLQQVYLDSVYAAFIGALPNDGERARGIVIGQEVAQAFMALRAGDGRNADVPYTFLPPGPGVYQLTPGAPAPPATPQTPWIAKFRPFTLLSPDQFRAPGPPALTSGLYAKVLNETKQYGAHDGSARTPEQTEIGLFFAENPANQLSRNIRLIAAAHGLSVADGARFFAQIYATVADAVVAAWDSKYHYNFWRPVTAIRAADIDGNPQTAPDPAWLPLVVTPGHPEYPAAHGCVTGGLAYALGRFFKTPNLAVTLTSTSVTGKPLVEHSYTNIHEIVREVINARVYGGMHFRTSGQDGATIGRKVAMWVARHYFKRVHDHDGDRDDDDDDRWSSAEDNAPQELSPATLPPLQKIGASVPGSFALEQNYPNPFNPSTKITFTLAEAQVTTLKVYDVLGREVATLTNEFLEPGQHEVTWDASGVTSGVYFYQLRSGQSVETMRLVLMR
jgi:hypothetical protein